ncbi:zinc-binding dehydrogenase [Paenibacillus sp. LMG 31459]|jgi:NADPH2:quinone reductase|uniref:Zinc-binding dehydrogenase n=1 Tax=Paenibacillus phytohabitans TaxID=2654978 RepID=A0ABX1YJG0_9BACL|nr:zinc-binding alcohol dehydrogenase [Paenibacillus phytohabitans]NOU81082.1 zinc-binding dehydrogenase [Paenibacillus phytohabitans]
MKAVLSQNGEINVAEIPAPVLEDGFVLVETEYSAISPGTEMMMNGAHRPKPIVLGYSAVGIIRSRGQGMEHWPVGQRVACYGGPYAKHAEWLLMPQHLMVPVPEHVSPVEASTVGLGAIAVHAVRQADLQFGETLVLIGAGILGQLIAQIARAAGCRVIVYDLLEARCSVAESLGIRHIAVSPEQVSSHLEQLTAGMGADAVMICAGGKSGGLVDQALEWVRNQGKVLLVGDVKADFSRELMFGKEAQVLISRAGGPGRYDPVYEKQGIDYPYGYVRWTEGRNMAEYIRLIAEGDIQVGPLISKVFPLERSADAFLQYAQSPAELLGAVLAYPVTGVQEAEPAAAQAREGQ